MSGGVPAARVGDPIAHSNAGTGMLVGALIGLAAGAVLVGATIATGGAALAVVAAVGGAAGLTSFGGLSGMNIGGASMGPVTGNLVKGSLNVKINGRFATMTEQGLATCSDHSGQIPLATGAATVKVNGLPAGRIGEKLGCSALVVAPCSPNVNIGGPSLADPNVVVSPEVPAWAVTGLQVLGIAGAIMALPYAIATVGVAATIGGGVASYFGGEYGGKAGRALGTAMGMSETGIRSMEAGGQFLGGMLGGAAGVKGVQAGEGALGIRALGVAREPAAAAAAAAPAPAYRPEVVASAERLGLPPSRIQEILDTPKADRPLPETYVSPERMAEHADAFKNGGSRLMTEGNLNKYGLGQRDGTTFFSTTSDTDAMLAEAGGDPRKLETSLGLPAGQLDNDRLVRVDFTPEAMKDLNMRMPSGAEAGANDQWLPGGFLPSGQNEAVIDGAGALPSHYTTGIIGP